MRAPYHWNSRRPLVLVSCQYCTFHAQRAGAEGGPHACPACGGSHWVLVHVDRHDFAQPCPVCRGKGTEPGYLDSPCTACGGCGWADRTELAFDAAPPPQGPMPLVR